MESAHPSNVDVQVTLSRLKSDRSIDSHTHMTDRCDRQHGDSCRLDSLGLPTVGTNQPEPSITWRRPNGQERRREQDVCRCYCLLSSALMTSCRDLMAVDL